MRVLLTGLSHTLFILNFCILHLCICDCCDVAIHLIRIRSRDGGIFTDTPTLPTSILFPTITTIPQQKYRTAVYVIIEINTEYYRQIDE
jgi:hypothetical protein